MKIALALVLAVHGAIHLLGFAKAFGLATAPALGAVGRPAGLLWLAAALACIVAAAALLAWPAAWWAFGAAALVLSQIAIATSWHDAKAGTLVNLLVLAPIALALLDLRPSGLPATYRRDVARHLAVAFPTPVVTEDDLAPLPPPVRDYVRRSGAVGRPRVHDLRARWRGELRNGDGPWMKVRVEQVEVLGDDPARLFYLEASRAGVPFTALHVYEAGHASMRVRVASLFDVVDARGPRMDQSETVTLLNDLCALAPSALVDPRIAWRAIDARHAGATFRHAGQSVSAELTFDDAGDLVGFVSNDRALSADGKTFEVYPWSTPLSAYRDYGAARVASRGDAVWIEPSGDFTYARFELESLEYDVAKTAPAAPTGVARF